MTRRLLLSSPFLAPLAKLLGAKREPAARKILVYVDWGYAKPGRIAGHVQVSENPVSFEVEPTFVMPFQRQTPRRVGEDVAGLCWPYAPSVVLLAFGRDAFQRGDDGPSVADGVTRGATATDSQIRFEAVCR